MITELTEVADHHRAAELITKIWGIPLLDPGLIRTIAHVGGYVAGARCGDDLTGISIGFFAADGHLHSHITGVLPDARGGLGYALKQHQREWALARGVQEVSWTFDPLVRRNAYLNFHKLGARAAAYVPDFYGRMRDTINAGGDTDRLYVTWHLTPPTPQPLPDSPPTILVSADGTRTTTHPRNHDHVAIATPMDIETLRTESPAQAQQWREAVRDALTTALSTGHEITDVTRDGWYHLHRP
ncbi:GNAT family N-acetyltransferase [Nonomuraea sp. NPDC050556]|uniref:GNAT family N-acetyltransferase n=1 Tax=Nonomuraea sp. NPDC050556 TaxID=3364369 RepID=UPI0037A5DCA3